MSLLDEAFDLLSQATALEQEADSAWQQKSTSIPGAEENTAWKTLEQSAAKYHEACYLMKRHVNVVSRQSNSSPTDVENNAKMRQLLVGKIDHYEKHADELTSKVKLWKLDFERKNEIMKQVSQAVNRASAVLTTAKEFDERGGNSEAEHYYLESVKGYLDAVKVLQAAETENAMLQNDMSRMQLSGAKPSQSQSQSADNSHFKELEASLKRKITTILDRVEELKKGEMAPLSNIQVRIKSVEPEVNEIHASSTSKNHHPTLSSGNPNGKEQQHHHQHQSLTPYEISVLMRSSTIASGLFLPWSNEEAQNYDYFASNAMHHRHPTSSSSSSAGVHPSSVRPWEDPDGLLTLSDKQQDRFFKWARPSEIAAMRSPPATSKNNSTATTIAMIDSITPYTIKQYCVSDCSFIAGLIISAAFESRLKRRLLSSLIYPQDSEGMPVYNPRGVYMVKFWLNGVARRVLVDDLLPVDKHGNLLCSHTIGGDGSSSSGRRKKSGGVLELWVSILEKAYMKLCGGYNFPGSNSGVDLFALTGWIPERIFFPEDPSSLQDFETPTERAWERLHSANSFGDCLITVSTSKYLTEEEADKVGLYTAHAYAVLDVVETSNGTRLLQLKNPWATKRWKGQYSWDDSVFAEIEASSTLASQHDDGVFWISWDDVLLYFRNLHLSWNPELFQWSTTIHGFWDRGRGPLDDSYSVGENPQYIISFSKEAVENNSTIWLLLSRHVTKQEQEGMECNDFLTLHIHRLKNPRQRVWYPGGSDCVMTNAYTNNQHVLIRYDVTGAEDKYLAIVLSQYKKSNDLGYTLKCYCTSKFKLGQPEKELPLYKVLHGSWELRNDSDTKYLLKIGSAGGPPGKGSFGSNPQWSIVVRTKTRMQIKCMAVKSLAVAVMLIQVNSEYDDSLPETPQKSRRVHHLYERPIIESGDYRHGFAITEPVNIPPGLYTCVASTFRVGEVGNFVLHIHASKDILISEIS